MIIGTEELEGDPGTWLELVLLRANEWLPSPRITYYEALLRDYAEAGDEYRSAVHRGLRKVLPEALDQRDRKILRPAIDFIRDARVAALAQKLKDLVRERTLDQGPWAKTDLHGRALEALNAIEDLDLVATWDEEKKHRRFAPLVFSFIRDSAPDELPLPSLFPDVARLGFLRHALESTVSELVASGTDDRGFDLLLEGARCMRESAGEFACSQYREAVIQLQLTPVLEHCILRELELERYEHLVVLSRLPGSLHAAVSDRLEKEDVRVVTDGEWDEDIENGAFLLLVRNSQSTARDVSDVDAPIVVNVCVVGEESYGDTNKMVQCSVAGVEEDDAEPVVDMVLRLLPLLASMSQTSQSETALVAPPVRGRNNAPRVLARSFG